MNVNEPADRFLVSMLRAFKSRPVLLVATAVTCLSVSGCSALDSFTGNQSMRWVGDDMLPKDEVEVNNYKAVALLPDLTVPEALKAVGKSDPTQSDAEQAVGEGWSLVVKQSEFSTSVRFSQVCEKMTPDATVAVEKSKGALASLGGDPDLWTWFTVPDAQGNPRTVAEPNIEERQTWATGSFAVTVGADGQVCTINGNLMGFEKVEGTTSLDSAYDTFQEARHTEGLAISGEYDVYAQTWTLESQGRLVPLWRFEDKDHGIVMVDLGDGLETALDTKSSLTESVTGGPSPAP